ncbi:T cell receptor alpha chain MC.7.G5 [Amia ocellicauda]|uniref:T cell receptor alpha chain MC.7.G5 n=1 Tax=Amia ocellicauda TaxID=2972642 RepID=UPI0034644A72
MHLLLMFIAVFQCNELGVESNPNIIQTPPTANLGERESVTFHCNLEDGEMGSYYMYWYRQHQSRAPEFIYREGDHYGQGFGERFVAKLESSNNKFSLHIKNALIEDSAIYYCAARAHTGGNYKLVFGSGTRVIIEPRGTGKLIFGTGTKLVVESGNMSLKAKVAGFCSSHYDCMNINNVKLTFGSGTRLAVQPKKKSNPSVYILKANDGPAACLVTDFSSYNTTVTINNITVNSEPTIIKNDDTYSMVLIMGNTTDKCAIPSTKLNKNLTSDTFTDTCVPDLNVEFETDEKMNFLSLTVLGLRILFLKSIVFNVIMTLRVWMS